MRCVCVLSALLALVVSSYGSSMKSGGTQSAECDQDGFFYVDDTSFMMCSNGFSYIMWCAPGTMNSPETDNGGGGYGAQRSFCDINLNDHAKNTVSDSMGAKPSTPMSMGYGGTHMSQMQMVQQQYDSMMQAMEEASKMQVQTMKLVKMKAMMKTMSQMVMDMMMSMKMSQPQGYGNPAPPMMMSMPPPTMMKPMGYGSQPPPPPPQGYGSQPPPPPPPPPPMKMPMGYGSMMKTMDQSSSNLTKMKAMMKTMMKMVMEMMMSVKAKQPPPPPPAPAPKPAPNPHQGYGSMQQQKGGSPQMFRGMFEGDCNEDGLYFMDEESYVVCDNGRSFVRWCAPGSANGPIESFMNSDPHKGPQFCSVNLVDSGFVLPFVRAHMNGGSSMSGYGSMPAPKPMPKPMSSGYGSPMPAPKPMPMPMSSGYGSPMPAPKPMPKPMSSGYGSPMPAPKPMPKPMPSGYGSPMPAPKPMPKPMSSGYGPSMMASQPMPHQMPSGYGMPQPVPVVMVSGYAHPPQQPQQQHPPPQMQQRHPQPQPQQQPQRGYMQQQPQQPPKQQQGYSR